MVFYNEGCEEPHGVYRASPFGDYLSFDSGLQVRLDELKNLRDRSVAMEIFEVIRGFEISYGSGTMMLGAESAESLGKRSVDLESIEGLHEFLSGEHPAVYCRVKKHLEKLERGS